MKKILLATTALVLSAGIANAQAVTIHGQGRMGVTYNGAAWSMEHRLRLYIGVAVEGDHGLSFGAYTRVQASGTAAGTLSASRVWVEASGLRLTFGNQDGAIASTMVGYRGIGYTGGTFNGSSAGIYVAAAGAVHQFASAGAIPANIASIRYTMGSTTVMLSHDVGGHSEIGVSAEFGAFTVAAGYGNGAGANQVTTVSGTYNGGSWGAGLIIARIGPDTNYTLAGNVALGGGTLNGYVGRVTTLNAYGLSYGYGLGGGATFAAGAERIGATTTGSIGVVFNF